MGLVTSRRKSNVSLNGCARRRRRTAGALTALSTDYTDLRSGREPSSMAAAMESTGEARSATAIESDLPHIEGVARMRVGTGAAYLLAGLCVGSLAFTSGATANAAGLASATNGSISGTVVDAAGQPVERVCVTASTPPHNGGEACTGANGRYTIAGLAPGEYGVEFIPYATDIYLVSQVWPHHQGLSAKGASVLVRAGHDHHGIDASSVMAAEPLSWCPRRPVRVSATKPFAPSWPLTTRWTETVAELI